MRPRFGEFVPRTPQEHQALYREQLQHPSYAAFLRSGVPVVGTWDDHDYGINNGDKLFTDRCVVGGLLQRHDVCGCRAGCLPAAAF